MNTNKVHIKINGWDCSVFLMENARKLLGIDDGITQVNMDLKLINHKAPFTSLALYWAYLAYTT